jgi:hypothetical protein
MRLALWPFGAGLGLLAATLSAQTLPVPSPRPGSSPEPGSTLPATPGAAPPPAEEPHEVRARPWQYEAALGAAWSSNIDFQRRDGPSDLTFVPSGMLARVFRGPRGELRAAAVGRWMAYANQKEFNRGYAEFSFDGRYQSSTRTKWTGSASYVLGHSDTSQPLLEQGVLLPLVKTRTLTGALGVVQRLGRRESLHIDGRLYRIEFDAPGWFDGASLRGTIALERQLGSRDTGAIVYSVEGVRADQLDNSYLTHFGSLQYTRVLSPRTAVLLEAGGSATPDRGRAGLDQGRNFFGGASVTRQVERSSLTAFVRREVAPAFGTSQSRLELRAGVKAIVPIGERWELAIDAIRVSPDDPEDADGAYGSTDDAALVLARRLGARLALSGRALFRRRSASLLLPSVRTFEASLVLSVTTPWGTARDPGSATRR